MPEPVSVIVTCYNLARYIEQAIQSVLRQTYAGEIQLIVVDDASTDGSRALLDGFAVIERIDLTRNGGVMKAMIAGLRRCRHDAVLFLDGDDVWHPEKVARVMERFGPGVKLCTHDLWYMDHTGAPIPRRSRVSEVLGKASADEHDRLIVECILHHRDYVWLGSAYGIRRSLADIEGFIRFCEARDYLETCYQDWPLAVWAATTPSGQMSYAPGELFGYRIHQNNYSGATDTLEKRRRNLRKALDTSRLIGDIAVARGCEAAVLESTEALRMRYEVRLACAQESRREMLRVAVANWKGLLAQGAPTGDTMKLVTFLALGGRRGNAAANVVKRALTAVRTRRA
jgi:glycosyltransferase involved in cell wall biosynthesis